jgi:hypothetical protein
MSREEFEEMFDLTLYEKVRSKYRADGAFPHLYDKVINSISPASVINHHKFIFNAFLFVHR